MISRKLKIFKLLLYKNFLTYKRRWKMSLFLEFMMPLGLFLIVWAIRNIGATPPTKIDIIQTFPIDNKKDLISKDIQLLVAPENQFIKTLITTVENCLSIVDVSTAYFKTEADLIEAYKTKYHPEKKIQAANIIETHDKYNYYKEKEILAVIFENENINNSTKYLKYKIRLTKSVPETLFFGILEDYSDNSFDSEMSGLQFCLDSSFIKIKGNSNFNLFTQKMPIPPHIKPSTFDQIFRKVFCVFALMAFLIPLCIETSNASDEKYNGTNVLMAMNGVCNYLNLLSWLVSGLIFSIFYIVPIVILLNFTTNDYTIPFFYYGNSFIFWLILTLNMAHLIAFGMHISAYFTRSLFMIVGLTTLYIGTSVISKFSIKESSLPIVPFLGIFFPNILLYRAFEEINYYEEIMEGIHCDNLFRVGNSAYGSQGSIGVILIFSILGTILHIILANYIYTINPGKYGARKNPFYFLKFFRKFKKQNDYDEIENWEFNNVDGDLFESVSDGVYTAGIQIRNLKKIYLTSLFNREKVYALKGISLDLYQKQITALLGHNGAGKTTMMSILTGMISATDGLVLVNKKNIKDHSEEIMNNMGLCPQENILFPHLSVAEQLKFFAMLKSEKSRKVVENDVKTLLQKFKLFDKRNCLPQQLSGGQKRRVCLSMALVGDSNILILDEPTSGLDPESRRDIWNVLLKMRGEKTILISTHDMEEADILGDRIAIVHSGSLRSYGTPLFLKKLLGRGNIEVTLSIEPSGDPAEIRDFIDPESEIINARDDQIKLSVPNTPQLPDSLDELENNKEKLGVTGISVSLITLEQVFLKVTQDKDKKEIQEWIDVVPKLERKKRFAHSAMGLLRKKMMYTIKNISTILIMLAMIILSLFCISSFLTDRSSTEEESNPLSISLNMYYDPKTIYSNDNPENKVFGDSYKTVTEQFQGKTVKNYSDKFNITEAMINIGIEDIANYDYHLLAGAQFLGNPSYINAIALYNTRKAVFALPISINLITNALLKIFAGSDYHLAMSVQTFPKQVTVDDTSMALQEIIISILVPWIFVSLLYSAVALFVVHPIRESIKNIKDLQRMSGASAFCYWGTMFAFDFIVFMLLAVTFIIGFLIIDAVLILRMLGTTEVLIMFMLFILLAINVLPIDYAFSFWKSSTSKVIRFLTLVPLLFVFIEGNIYPIFYAIDEFSGREDPGIDKYSIYRTIQKSIFLMTPYISYYHGMISFFQTALKNSICRRASAMTYVRPIEKIYHCREMQCVNGTCANPLKYFDNFERDVSLETGCLMLFITSIFYIGILCMLETKLFSVLTARIYGEKPDNTDRDFDEQVKKVKHNIAFEISKIKTKEQNMTNKTTVNGQRENIENGIEEVLSDSNEVKHIFLVYELRKLYKKFVAVQDVSFDVNQRECFGLLGVNGAGKSTTFRMMTGEDIPNNGLIYLNGKELSKNRDCYSSEMGYCPQTDALIKSLNSYEHLRLFARLRGIPEDQVETEVKKWINRLNLNACASQPSRTYSGGNKRRLNIAIALIGNPNLVLLDEPTTGVDPGARRSLWNVIQNCQNSGQAVILTSHSMEECEALCNRLAIMVAGKLQCIGASQELKQRFGAGYNIQIKLNPEKSKDEIDLIKEKIEKILNGQIMDENPAYLMYHLTSRRLTWRRMHDVMNQLKNQYSSIEDFSVLSSTLEQLFLMFARTANDNRI